MPTQITPADYDKLVQKASPPSRWLKNCLNAFWVGGLICVLGQALTLLYQNAGLGKDNVAAAVPITLIALAAVTTGLGWYDDLAKLAGAGSLVPITGFANAVVAPAIEFKSEGHVPGIGAKMFTVAGPVLVYGITAACVYGLILCLFRLFA